MEVISVTQLASILNISRQNVLNLCKKGVYEKAGKGMVFFDGIEKYQQFKSKYELKRKANINQAKVELEHNSIAETKSRKTDETNDSSSQLEDRSIGFTINDLSTELKSKFTDLEYRKKIAETEMKEMELAIKQKKYILVSEADEVAEALAYTIKTKLYAIPVKLPPLLAKVKDDPIFLDHVYDITVSLINEALEAISAPMAPVVPPSEKEDVNEDRVIQ